MLKGTTTIELTDVNTNKTEVIKEDNIVTNAFNKFVNSRGRFMAPVYSRRFFGDKILYNNSNSLVDSLFGGLMLFDQPLNEDPNDFSIPSNVSCVGYATDVANSGTNLMKGTYNQHESGFQEDGSRKFVWDFTTNQANGQIGSVCLVPLPAAKMGWGNKHDQYDWSLAMSGGSVDVESFIFSSDASMVRVENDYLKLKDPADMYFFHKDNYIYGFASGNLRYSSRQHSSDGNHVSKSNKIKLIKRHFSIDEVSPFDAPGSLSFQQAETDYETIEIDLPSEISTYLTTGITRPSYNTVSVNSARYLLDVDDKHIYMYLGGEYSPSVPPNGTFPILKINIDTWQTEVLTITNTTSETFKPSSNACYTNYTRNSKTFAVIKGKLIINVGNPTKIFIIDLADNTNVKEVVGYDGSSFTLAGNYAGYMGLKYKDYLFISGTSLCDKISVINSNTGICFPLYLSGNNSYCLQTTTSGLYPYTSLIVPYDQEKYGEAPFLYDIRETNDNYYYRSMFVFGLNVFSLMTKNNLSSPVTKTSAQTMKITYTLSEVK
jgi:hypothetical protein